MKFVNRLLWALLSLSLTALIIIGMGLFYAFIHLPNVEALKDVKLQVPLRIYSKDGQLIAEYGEMRRSPVTLDEIPKPLIQAVLATEDQRYFEHPGVDIIGLMRAAKELFITGQKTQGASTITMQVARNFFLTRQKTFSRKIDEILLALKIDHAMNKEKILELYLNKIYLGERAYGVAAAAEVYYGKELTQLTLAEMALIGGLPQAPSRDNPIINPQAAINRRNHVLQRMLERGYINKKTYQHTILTPNTASYHGQHIQLAAPYLGEMVRSAAVNEFGEIAYTQGLKAYTTIDTKLQEYANSALQDGLAAYDKRHKNQNKAAGALVALNPSDGAILALVGGANFNDSHFNRAIQAERQPGSSFKPFIYSAAFAKGYTLASVINDEPIIMKDYSTGGFWRPENDTLTFYGPTRLRVALSKSRNLVSIRLLQAIGIPYTIDYLSNFGFDTNKLPATPSLALGTGGVTPLQLTTGYAIFANGGYKVNPYFIDHITDSSGQIIYQAKPQVAPTSNKPTTDAIMAPQAITPQNAYLITNALQDVIINGTGRRALILHRKDLAGKTGTTNNHMDAWFAGFNSDLAATVWVGFDQPKSLGEYGAQVALPIWIDFMKQALAGKPEHTMAQPENIVTARIDPSTGLLATPSQTDAIFEIFAAQDVPQQYASTPNDQNSADNLSIKASNTSDEPLF